MADWLLPEVHDSRVHLGDCTIQNAMNNNNNHTWADSQSLTAVRGDQPVCVSRCFKRQTKKKWSDYDKHLYSNIEINLKKN